MARFGQSRWRRKAAALSFSSPRGPVRRSQPRGRLVSWYVVLSLSLSLIHTHTHTLHANFHIHFFYFHLLLLVSLSSFAPIHLVSYVSSSFTISSPIKFPQFHLSLSRISYFFKTLISIFNILSQIFYTR